MDTPHLEAVLPLLIAIATLLAMISLRNSDVATRARNCREEFLYKVRSLPTPQQIHQREANLKKQINQFQTRYRLMSAAFILLVFAAAGVGLYGSALLGKLIGTSYEKWTLQVSLFFFCVGILVTIVEMWRGPETLELNGKD